MAVATKPLADVSGWRFPRLRPSLPEAHRTVAIPAGASVWRKVLAFAGPWMMNTLVEYLQRTLLSIPGALG